MTSFIHSEIFTQCLIYTSSVLDPGWLSKSGNVSALIKLTFEAGGKYKADKLIMKDYQTVMSAMQRNLNGVF